MRAVLLTTVTLLAFAANSVLCRLALADATIDALHFTMIRLTSAAIVLAPFLRGGTPSIPGLMRSAPSAAALAVYAFGFSWAYVEMDAGVGALILFGMVQVTMIGAWVVQGARPTALQWLGVASALGGLVYLVSPGLAAPPIGSALWMTLAGVGWGVYSLLGKRESNPIYASARNFALTLIVVLPVAVLTFDVDTLQWRGVALAITSGALTSGVGYVLWYFALRRLTAVVAAVVQLAVPITAAMGGVLFISEPLSLRLLVASALILGGIFAVIWANQPGNRPVRRVESG